MDNTIVGRGPLVDWVSHIHNKYSIYILCTMNVLHSLLRPIEHYVYVVLNILCDEHVKMLKVNDSFNSKRHNIKQFATCLIRDKLPYFMAALSEVCCVFTVTDYRFCRINIEASQLNFYIEFYPNSKVWPPVVFYLGNMLSLMSCHHHGNHLCQV
ncbi:hypothetical protein FF38_13479 [Lucilia cuprina]|uniref:Uncharacterized protein n=1 Tax=Lucilia cuprina TaxID=7375 RepID=A0A0L0BRC5_LUCCU|nr:hypothetical protein FF38_13479 [Lucilia cuprina]